MVRFYEVLIALTLLGCGVGASRAIWFDPGDVVENLPKDTRTNASAYRSHYRYVIIHGGK